MANRKLRLDEILGIVNETASPLTGYPPPGQVGPIRFYEKEMRCSNKDSLHAISCGSPTYAKAFGIPLCVIHLIRSVNKLLYEMTEKKELPADCSENSGKGCHNFEVKLVEPSGLSLSLADYLRRVGESPHQFEKESLV